jgi:anti-anti-sigma factor
MAPKTGVTRLWKLASRSGVENGTIVLYLEGRLGRATAGDFKAAIEAAGNGQSLDLVIDLAGVDYLSSAALKMLESAASKQVSQGRKLTLRAPSPAARLSLELSGLNSR